MEINNRIVTDEINPESVERGSSREMWLHLTDDAMGNPLVIPVVIIRGAKKGKTLGITSAVHGNEINGIPIIQTLIRRIDPKELTGTIVAVPVVNVPAFKRKKRRFPNNVDINHVMPGDKKGNVSSVYAYRFFHKVVKNFDILLDLHTASFGRINSYYIRADMRDKTTAKLSRLQNAQIIVHNRPADGTLRGAASALGIPSVTLEVGNPNTFQKGVIRSSLTGIFNAMIELGMIEGEIDPPEKPAILCKTSYWIYTDRGGILTVSPEATQLVQKGERIAVIKDVFGKVLKEYFAPEKGVVIGKSVSPVNQTGGRILHLGLLKN